MVIGTSIVPTSAKDLDPDPLVPQGFGILDSDPQKYADPRIRIQGGKYQPKRQKNLFTLNIQIRIVEKREIIIIS